MMREKSLSSLISYIEKEGFKGYDPYDTLLSPIPFHWLGKWGSAVAIQVQKRNPVNIRRIIGIGKEFNPKAMGLFLHSYTLLWLATGDKAHREKADFFFDWLQKNQSQGFTGNSWGYNFPWANPEKDLPAFTPTGVVTGFIARGLWAYYRATGEQGAAELIRGAARFIRNDLETTTDSSGVCFSYTPVKRDICYNASLLGAEVLAMAAVLDDDGKLSYLAGRAVEFVVKRQKADGRWNYSLSPDQAHEREQIDFHQGYILDSIHNISELLGNLPEHWESAMRKGLQFYRSSQFTPEGVGFWRLPRRYPVEIHNQAQGVLSCTRLGVYDSTLPEFAGTIADWTIRNMQCNDGHFYYQVRRTHKIRIPYMRWSQAWMMLALVTLLYHEHTDTSQAATR